MEFTFKSSVGQETFTVEAPDVRAACLMFHLANPKGTLYHLENAEELGYSIVDIRSYKYELRACAYHAESGALAWKITYMD